MPQFGIIIHPKISVDCSAEYLALGALGGLLSLNRCQSDIDLLCDVTKGKFPELFLEIVCANFEKLERRWT